MMRDEARMVDWSDRLKYVRLSKRDGWYMSVGGDIRPFYERYRDEEWELRLRPMDRPATF